MSLPERELLRVIAALNDAPDVVLVGGQALYYWYRRYAPNSAQLRALPVPTSKDVDFQGTAAAAARCAERIPGRCIPADFEKSTVSSALVEFIDAGGERREVDFIIAPHGLTAKAVQEKSAVVSLPR